MDAPPFTVPPRKGRVDWNKLIEKIYMDCEVPPRKGRVD